MGKEYFDAAGHKSWMVAVHVNDECVGYGDIYFEDNNDEQSSQRMLNASLVIDYEKMCLSQCLNMEGNLFSFKFHSGKTIGYYYYREGEVEIFKGRVDVKGVFSVSLVSLDFAGVNKILPGDIAAAPKQPSLLRFVGVE